MVAQHAAYRRFEPPGPLRPLVEHAWITHHGGAGEPEVVLPDGRGLLLVVQGAPARLWDPLSGVRVSETTSVRGPASRVLVRTVEGPGTRLGVQLTPLGLAQLTGGVLAATPEVEALIGRDALDRATERLAAGDDDGAVALVLAALAAAPRTAGDELDRLAEVLALAESERGIVRAGDLARRAGVPIGVLHRWCIQLLGVEPAAWLSAVRFSAFVRESVGQGPVRPRAVLAAIEWYARAGYSPRESERFTGLGPGELRRLVDKLEEALAGR